MALAPVFGMHPFWWQLTGILLRILVALALGAFTLELTGSTIAAGIAGLGYAATFGSLDATTWISAHHVLWSALFLCIALTQLLRYCKKNSGMSLGISLLFFCLFLCSDPYQNFTVIFLLPFIPVLAGQTKKACVRFLKVEGVALLGAGAVGVLVMRRFIFGSQLYFHLLQHHSLGYIVSKLYLTGNYFNSLANLMVGWAMPVYEEASTGDKPAYGTRRVFTAAVRRWHGAYVLENKSPMGCDHIVCNSLDICFLRAGLVV